LALGTNFVCFVTGQLGDLSVLKENCKKIRKKRYRRSKVNREDNSVEKNVG